MSRRVVPVLFLAVAVVAFSTWWLVLRKREDVSHSRPTKHIFWTKLTAPSVSKGGPFIGALVQADLETGQPRRVQGAAQVFDASTALEAANKFLAGTLSSLAMGASPNDLHMLHQVDTLTGTHITYVRYYGGLPVLGDEVSIRVAADNKTITDVYNGLSDIKTAQAIEVMATGKSPMADDRMTAAIKLALSAVEAEGATSIKATPAILAGKDGATGVWGVTFLTKNPPGSWRVTVNESGTEVVSKINIAQYADGIAMVFAPNPVQYTGDATLGAKITGDFDGEDTKLNNARIQVTLHNLDNSGYLQGDYASTALVPVKKRARDTNHVYNYTRGDKRFEEVMVYYWVTECELYLQSLGYTNAGAHKRGINVRPIGLDPHFSDKDQSFYSPDTKTLQFGDGGVEDAEDAEVILHELGHAIQDSQVPGFGGGQPNSEARAMGEGFGDYWAASFFSDVGPATWHVFWDKWDGQAVPGAHPAGGGNPAYLRRLDTSKMYPEGLVGEEHADGEIWSACLWAIHGILGRQKADTIILESHYSVPPGGVATFADGARAILAANQALFASDKQDEIMRIFASRGILPKP